MNIFIVLFFDLFLLFSNLCKCSNSNKDIVNNFRKLETQCDKGFYLNGGSCFACYENCFDCDGIKCTECEDGFYPSQMNCNKCYPNCLKCDGIKCTQCLEGYYPNNMDCFKFY